MGLELHCQSRWTMRPVFCYQCFTPYKCKKLRVIQNYWFFFIISCDLFLKLSSLTLGGKAERNCLSASLKVSIQKMTRIDIEQNYTNFHKTPMSFMNVNFYRNEPLMLRSQKGLQSLLSQCFNYVHGKQRWNSIFEARLGFDDKREQELLLLSPVEVVFPLSK